MGNQRTLHIQCDLDDDDIWESDGSTESDWHTEWLRESGQDSDSDDPDQYRESGQDSDSDDLDQYSDLDLVDDLDEAGDSSSPPRPLQPDVKK